MAAKTAILKAKIEGIIYEMMVKTTAANVYVDDSTTLAAKLSSIISDIATKASTSDLNSGLATKANVSHTHAQSEVTGLTDALAAKASTKALTEGLATKADASHTHAQSDITGLTDALAAKASTTALTEGLAKKADASHTHAQSDITGLTDALALLAAKTEVTSAIDALRQEMLGDTPVEAYNTFTELAAYIAEHKEAADALTAAVGNKADKATTLTGYGITDAYTKTEVDTKISDAISSATGGESAASVKASLETYKTNNDARVDALEANTHTHANKTVIDGITANKVSAWDGNATIYYSATEPANLTAKDLWVQIVE